MALNLEEASGFENFGWKALNEDGDVLFYLTFGDGSPVGQAAPVPTIYVQREDSSIWKKTGPTNSEWEQVSAAAGDTSVGGAGVDYVFLPGECVGGMGV